MKGVTDHSGFLLVAAVMFAAGLGIPITAALSSGLGKHLASPAAATFILYVVGLVLSGAIVAMVGFPKAEKFAGIPPQLYLGAVFVVFYVLSISWAAPRIGVGNSIFFVLLGQLIAAAVIDHFALFGAAQSSISVKRVAGIVVMAFGVYLARKPV
ncbi:MAG: DMT family transporter [Novosphingobium sp.]|nr:DMT family transporter [Novosphingobium sp.]